MTKLQSYRLKAAGPGDIIVGWFGGHPRGIRSQDWPRCAICAAPMCHMAQIDAGPWLALDDCQRLSIFICHATGGQCEDWEPYKGSNRVVIQKQVNDMLFDGPPTVRVYRKVRLTVEPLVNESGLLEEAEGDPDELNALTHRLKYDKLGGGAVWVHNDATLRRSDGRAMRLVMQMTTNIVKFDITDDGMAYVFLDSQGSASDNRAYLIWQGN
jgi:hypothetical protein